MTGSTKNLPLEGARQDGPDGATSVAQGAASAVDPEMAGAGADIDPGSDAGGRARADATVDAHADTDQYSNSTIRQSPDHLARPCDLADGSGPATPPPPELVSYWQAAGVVGAEARWAPMAGGRTNATWRIDPRRATPSPDPSLVCKLYRAEADTPLFANDPDAEALALAALTGTGLAPQRVATAQTPAGGSLVYTHVEGHPWRNGDDPAAVGRALARLHAIPAPAALPHLPIGAAALAAQAQDMLDSLGEDGRALASDLAQMTGETPPDLPPCPRVFVHGDATAGNVLVTAATITFIDWQCPALGDPCEDIATFLSPAMQEMSGNAPLSDAATAAFLDGYGAPDVAARYRALAPFFHARMAAYCLWRAARGDAGYGAAAALETACLRAASPPRPRPE